MSKLSAIIAALLVSGLALVTAQPGPAPQPGVAEVDAPAVCPDPLLCPPTEDCPAPVTAAPGCAGCVCE